MHGNVPFGVASATEIARRNSREPDKIVGRTNFYFVAKVLWPENTAAQIASIAKRDVRSAERWLAGESDPPICLAAVFLQLTFPQRE